MVQFDPRWIDAAFEQLDETADAVLAARKRDDEPIVAREIWNGRDRTRPGAEDAHGGAPGPIQYSEGSNSVPSISQTVTVSIGKLVQGMV